MTTGEQIIAFLECLPVPEGKNVGKPLQLEPFQKRFIIDVYDNPNHTKTAILSMARKNGKTALIAGLVLAHLVGPAAVLNSQIVSGARTRDQAALVFKLASKMVSLSPELSSVIRIIPSSKTLVGLPMNVEYKALAADGSTAQGLSPILAIMDEVGQIKGAQDDFYDAILTSQGAYDTPLMINISTQAPTDADLLSILIDDAQTGRDPRTVCHVYAAPEGCELDDLKAWKAANPALESFRSLDDMKDLAARAANMPSFANSFRNLNLNQRVNAESPFVTPEDWKACIATYDETPFLKGKVWGGLDLSMKTDLTAFVMVALYNGVYYVKAEVFTPKDTLKEREKTDRAPYLTWVNQGHLTAVSGKIIDYKFVAERLIYNWKRYNITAIAYDRLFIDILEKELQSMGVSGLPFVPWGQGYMSMSKAINSLEEVILNGTFKHDNNPLLNMSVNNARIETDHTMGRRFTKKHSHGRIDPLVALAMAAGVAKSEPEKPKPNYAVSFLF